ncbi:hypothetical protein JCM10914A_25490 [Paenibacillus sp. JCM 10914]|uniref:hypothetical protein n=1 Tax=Paenibacillus sp. JCM 10914 TaxID=1236974 RepID=UPI0003CC4E20|nr:hypothetical protein [Paenibacillus sp. JCM 10914]GAE09544.1 hypothetical protein JCM10914_5909 [Paenibacillus sp. JCM 10914]
MNTDRNNRYLSQDMQFFAAALSEALVSVWEEDPASVYVEIERGYIEGYTPDVVRIRNEHSGVLTHYSRDTAMFQRV